jgi:prepilin-type N-terminal cleavage/methylation domain-containing protein
MGQRSRNQGFTLIELSIVLVVIGLIVGGILVGQNLINSATARAQVTQIEKYNTAVNTFRGKYGGLPGDMSASIASQFGFMGRGTGPGQGDGNGVIEGFNGSVADGFYQDGETLFFWVDLSVGNPSWAGANMGINLIDGTFNTYPNLNYDPSPITAATAPNYFPAAKLGGSNYVYVYSTGGVNYFGVAPMNTWYATPNTLTASIPVQQAYQIDKKVDDGLPATGTVTATWDSGNLNENAPAPAVNAAASDSATSCYNTTSGTYSINISNGANPNCAISFRFQ